MTIYPLATNPILSSLRLFLVSLIQFWLRSKCSVYECNQGHLGWATSGSYGEKGRERFSLLQPLRQPCPDSEALAGSMQDRVSNNPTSSKL